VAERAAQRLPWLSWGLLGLAGLGLLHWRMPWLLHGRWLFAVGIALVAMLLAATALWRAPPATMACAAVALTIFSGSWGSLGLPGFPFLPDRLLLTGAVLALLLRTPAAAPAPRMRLRGVHLLLLVTVVYACLSAAAAGTLATQAGAFDLLDRLGAIPFLMLLVGPALFSGRRERDALLATLVGLGGYLGVTALFESLGPHALVVPHYIVEYDATKPFGQAGGPFKAPITEGFACFACAAAALIALRQWRSRGARALAALVAALCVLGVFLTLERGVWIAAAAGAGAVLVAAPELRRWLAPAVCICAALCAVVLLSSSTLAGNTSARASDQTPVWDRQNQTAAALRMIAARPLFGFGWDRYKSASLDYFRQAGGYPMTGFANGDVPLPLHNSYLSNAVELGLVGALLWLASLLWGVGGAILTRAAPELRPWRLGLIAIAVFFCVLAFFDPLAQNFVQLLLWLWAGVVLAGAAPPPDGHARPRPPAADLRRPA
jgi:putative inorganic carbon (HCO3(-)) transporter